MEEFKREDFESFGLVPVFTIDDRIFHMLITKGFDETKTIDVMRKLTETGITDHYPIIITTVTDDNLFDAVLLKSY